MNRRDIFYHRDTEQGREKTRGIINTKRPVLISVIQYQEELKAGTLTVLDLIDKLQGLGVDGIELRRELWPDYAHQLLAVKERIAAVGKLVTYATFSTLFSPDAVAHKLLLHDLDTAKALGSPLLRVFPGAAPADTTDAKWTGAIEAVAHATSLGVVIALENWGKLPGGLLSEMTHILNHIPSPTLKVNVDIGNYATHGEDVLDAIEVLGERVVYAHLKDNAGEKSDDTTYLGGGQSPMREIMTALNALPQRVIYCFEFVGGGEPDARIAKSLAYLRE